MTRKEAIETLKANYPDACFGQLRDAVDTAISALKQPEIIYCRECKWKQGAECVMFADVRPFPDDFCSRAERSKEQ
jgi:hypothetical protein